MTEKGETRVQVYDGEAWQDLEYSFMPTLRLVNTDDIAEQFYLTRNMLAAIVSTFEETGVNFPFPELYSEAKRVLKEVDGER